MRASGLITGFTVTVNLLALGWTTEAYVESFCRVWTSPSAIGAARSGYPEANRGLPRSPGRWTRRWTVARRTCSTSSRWWSALCPVERLVGGTCNL